MKHWLTVGAILGGISVLLGAFGAHALKEILVPERLVTYETAVRYQFYHALALLAVGGFSADNVWAGRAGALFTLGIVLFAGSLYLLCATGLTMLGAITPLGGLSFMAGWICLALASRQ
ncbi:MAG: DUF423 domain-containing protein [Candidatus Eremiobacteraeota bacterium]|nr:DUF423 domain-containing protein [Candidatus Eremiobacteraeota bacterium]